MHYPPSPSSTSGPSELTRGQRRVWEAYCEIRMRKDINFARFIAHRFLVSQSYVYRVFKELGIDL